MRIIAIVAAALLVATGTISAAYAAPSCCPQAPQPGQAPAAPQPPQMNGGVPSCCAPQTMGCGSCSMARPGCGSCAAARSGCGYSVAPRGGCCGMGQPTAVQPRRTAAPALPDCCAVGPTSGPAKSPFGLGTLPGYTAVPLKPGITAPRGIEAVARAPRGAATGAQVSRPATYGPANLW